MAYKNRKKKLLEYDSKYSHIPKDYAERLEWMYDKYKISEKANNILKLREEMINTFKYETISFVLYEIPEGKERPRFRVISKQQLINGAINNPNFVHVYSLSAQDDHVYMNRLVNSSDIIALDQLLCTPVYAEFISYFPTPKSYSQEKIFLAEMGLDRPLSKPDFDNIEKKYADMFNQIIWLDDIFVVDGVIKKFYSILPRLEIRLHFMNMVYNKRQYDMISNRKDFTEDMKLEYFKGGNNNEHKKIYDVQLSVSKHINDESVNELISRLSILGPASYNENIKSIDIKMNRGIDYNDDDVIRGIIKEWLFDMQLDKEEYEVLKNNIEFLFNITKTGSTNFDLHIIHVYLY